MKKIVIITNLLIVAATLYGCGKSTTISNEETALVMSTDIASGVFSPFYSTSGVDSTMAGMTQISMLSSTANGEVAYGDDEAVVVKDMSQTLYDENGNVSSEGDDDGTTVYQFVIKNDVQFSDGEYLDIHDVLFNMYLYLDPVYTGSSTMYSTDIVGLSAYRTQDPDMTEESMSQYENTFSTEADEFMDKVEAYICDDEEYDTETETEIKAVINELREMFYDELLDDWDAYETDLENLKLQYNIDSVWQAFLLCEGIINIATYTTGTEKGNPIINEAGQYEIDFTGWTNDSYDKDYCIDTVYNYYMGTSYTNEKIMLVFNYYACGTELYNNIVADYKTAYFDRIKEDGLVVNNISGVTVIKGSEFTGGDSTYGDEYDVLQIVINGVDPKAIWNFAFTVAPMHYYSDDYYTALADDADVYSSTCSDFGVNFGDADWYQDVVKAKNSIPMGAGSYQMSTSKGISASTTEADLKNGFYNNGMIYFERNEYFVMGAPIIKYISYKEVTESNVMNAIVDGSIAFATPSATQDNIATINSKVGELDYTMTQTSGYGYIGINAKYVKDVEIRQAIMTAMDVGLILDYYPGGLAEIIYRPMSLVSWVYSNSDGSTWNPAAVYDYNDGIETITQYVENAGYKLNSAGKYYKTENGTTSDLTYTFTIAGTTTDHPAYNVMQKAATLLNANGWTITVRTDSTALTKLSTGGLEVWAAAWSSTIDPDMYQVYHIDSTASSSLNWGYDYIKSNQSEMAYEYELINELSDLIDLGRSVLDQETRTSYYRDALDLVMELAVELPTYQRNDLYVYNSTIIDTSTLIPASECTPYYGPLSEIWNVSLNVE